jgi:hypothetical protein
MHSKVWPRVLAGAIATAIAGGAMASSHREAPFITTLPKVDATDFYMFNSYETNRAGYVTLIAAYQPLESPQGGPNYYFMDPNALYEIMIDNDGDAKENITFQFRFTSTLAGLPVTVGGKSIPVPFQQLGAISSSSSANQNTVESYTLTMVTGDRRTGTSTPLVDTATGSMSFPKPFDNTGTNTFPPGTQDYATYAASFIRTFNIPGCTFQNAPAQGKVFVGQRQDPFVVNLGEIFDLVNIKYPAEELYTAGPQVNARNLAPNTLAGLSVTAIELEIPNTCLTNADGDPVIGGWTTASLRQAQVLNPVPQNAKSEVDPEANAIGSSVNGGAWTQVSRLGMPLTNEVIIGLPDKDRWNATPPSNDAQFVDYVTNPSLPVVLGILFATGLKAVGNMPTPPNGAAVVPAEMLRLNTSTAVTPVGQQSDLGFLANPEENFPNGNADGFPNGRRPIDDVLDIELRVAMGLLLPSTVDMPSQASRNLHYTDGAEPNAGMYLGAFPYLNTPAGGAPTFPVTPGASQD